jgi:signal transduction histidine kinase/ligand-binding sensor domain-containing protein
MVALIAMDIQDASVRPARFARLAVVFAALAECVFALDPSHTITQYGHTAWTVQGGQLPGIVYSLTQTRDGWLWVGTEFGLFRFDGVRFSPLEAPGAEDLRGQTISALAPAPDGGLWIGTRHSLSRWNGSAVQQYRTVNGVTEIPVSAIHVDRGGKVWVGTVGFASGGLARIESNGLRFYTPAEGFSGGGVYSIAEDHAGNLWIGCGNGLYRWDGGRFQVYGSNARLKTVTAIAETPDGGIVAGNNVGGLKRLAGGIFRDYPIKQLSSRVQTRDLLTDRDGGLWIGASSQGLIHMHQDSFDRFTHADGLSGDMVLSLFEDREGNVWAGTQRGLDRFRDLPVTTLSKREGLSDDAASSVFASGSGGVWIGTSAGLNRVEGDRITVFDRRAGLPSDSVGSIYEDRRGRLWVSSSNGLVFGWNGRFHAFRGGGGLQSIAAAAEDRDGRLWFADQAQGLIAVQANEIKKVIPWSLFGNKQVWALDADCTRGGLFIGFAEGGVAYYRDGLSPRWYTVADGLGGRAVTDIHIDTEGTAWIATQSGLSRLHDGRLATLTAKNGLACDQIHSMVEDRDGYLWLNTPCGLQSLAPKELAAWAANPSSFVHPKVYTASDGMHLRSTTGGFFRRAARSTDGRLWFPVIDGVAVVDPKRLHGNPLPPPVAIEALRVDDRMYPFTPNLRVGPIRKELQIDYTALSLVDPDRVQFRYRLEGEEKEWRSVLGRRHAFYPSLSPGRHRFRVTACNNDGVWNEAGASFDFTVAPTVYQTAWFRLLCVAGIAAALWGLHLVRLRYLQARMHARFEERLRERTRIGRELHDTLLQNIAGFALQLGGLSKTVVKEPQSAAEKLSDLRRDAEQWLHEARESVWDLRSGADGQPDLCEAVRGAAEQITDGTPVQFSMAIAGSRQAMLPAVQEHLLRIVLEAVRNAVRHAQATEVHVDVSFSAPRQVRIRIMDNGCGFDLATGSRKPGHWGLATMRERARKVGAEIEIAASPGQGTRIDITCRHLPAKETSISYA